MRTLPELIDRLDEEPEIDRAMNLIYMWVKQGVADQRTFRGLLTWLFQQKV